MGIPTDPISETGPDPSGEDAVPPKLTAMISQSGKFSRHPNRFDGNNPRGWICKCIRYFQLNMVVDAHKVDLASIHLDDSDNYVVSFNKLSQKTTVEEYFDRYESLKALMKAHNPSSSEDYYTMSFISGLKEEIRKPVQMFKPSSETDAFYLARMQQASVDFQSKQFRPFSRPFQPSTTPYSSSTPSVKHMKVRRDNGLCYNYDEFYKKGHICKTPQLFMLIASEETGMVTPTTIRVPGCIQSHDTFVLIDTDSTRSFVDAKLAERLHLNVAPISPMLVTIANGDTTISKGFDFSSDLRILPLGGYDMVLGVDWMTQLGDIVFNLAELRDSFFNQGQHINLQGNSSSPTCNMIRGYAIMKFLKDNTPTFIGQFFSISAVPLEPVPANISAVVESLSDIFTAPTYLPPKRALDHQIPLKPNFEPVSQRPYRCPHLQKAVVEQLIQEMLDAGFIQESHSPFASPFLLINKKDGSWSFCVEYRKLNDITVKDKFLILLIDDLLDELNGAIIFSKIDLKFGYYQILMKLDDIHKTAFRNHQGHYEFRVMLFGLTNDPATF
ncbi:uncharacterized protein LOC113305564 [Papaver somniferum]|uniref:uncharacterized protein LOC113305564 n=1 Tax=Papaver somniferum TaxID=3469 RepID=UPI000E6F5C5F|nr:uncharacterized protein LOC113305564 [Papaver somniferum]